MKNNPKQFFEYLNSKRKIKNGVSELKDKNGKICENSLDNANILGNFFANTFVQEPNESDFENFIIEPASEVHDISDILFCTEEVKYHLSNLKIHKSGGPDKIHPKLLKTLSTNHNFVEAVTSLFNRCIETGRIPDIWKSAQVTALHKKGAKWDAQNYRPISLTCILCKVFEKTIRNHVMKHFLHFVTSAQHGFLEGKSCLSNLFECFDKIDEIMNDG